MTKICEVRISLITGRLKLKFKLTITNALLKHCKYQKQKNDHEHILFLYNVNVSVT